MAKPAPERLNQAEF